MDWNAWIRPLHRWASIAFTLTVIANCVVMGTPGGQQPPAAALGERALPHIEP
jgi:hypothetical protein